MPLNSVIIGWLVLAAAVCVFAGWKGGVAERLATAIIVLNLIVSTLGDGISSYRGVGSLTVDALTAFGFLALTLQFGRPWLGVAMLIFALQFALHAFYFVTNKSPHDMFHATVNNLNFFAVLVCLLFGTLGAIRRRRTVAPGA